MRFSNTAKSSMIDAPEVEASRLLTQARFDGDLHSLATLLEYYRPMLMRLSQRKVSRSLNGKVSPSEVSQLTIISASQKFGEFRGETVEQFRSWLCVILDHAITDQTRRFLAGCRDTSRETSLSRDVVQTDTERPSQICSSREQVLRLLRVVEEMPCDLRTIVRMRYQQDLAFSDIATYLGLSSATVRRRWLMAVQHIERAMV